jgi:hypothetical protein
LPEPFRPKSVVTRPGSAQNEADLSATASPYDFPTPSAQKT